MGGLCLEVHGHYVKVIPIRPIFRDQVTNALVNIEVRTCLGIMQSED